MLDMNDYKIIDVTDYVRLALRNNLLEQYKSDGVGENFVKTIDQLAKNIASLPLDYKRPLKFSFLVLPTGKEFGETVGLPIEKGMCGAPVELDENYPLSLCVDDDWFANGFVNLDFESQVSLTHELAHIVHGGYFRNLGQLREGFAELLPHYLMNFEEKNIQHQKAIMTLQEDEMQTMAFMNQNGMYACDSIDGRKAQQRTSYISVYLWMLAYTKRLEKLHHFNKFEATNFMLNNFSKIEGQNWNEKIQVVADMIEMPVNEVMNTKKLQKEGQHYITRMQINQNLKRSKVNGR